MPKIEVGRLTGANKVIISVVSLVSGKNMLSIKMIDVKTATVELQKSQIVNPSELLNAAEPLTLELLSIKQETANKRIEISGYKDCNMSIMSHDLYTKELKFNEIELPEGWQLPTRKDLKCMCENQRNIRNFESGFYYFTKEFDEKGKIYVISFDDCGESAKDINTQKAAVRCIKKTEKQKEVEEDYLSKNKKKEDIKNANKNLNGHYISLGSSAISSGYYGGVIGLSYEYRYKILGFNFSIGYNSNIEVDHTVFQNDNHEKHHKHYNDADKGMIVNIGIKTYFSNRTKFFRNFYANFMPFCFFGEDYNYYTFSSFDNNINSSFPPQNSLKNS